VHHALAPSVLLQEETPASKGTGSSQRGGGVLTQRTVRWGILRCGRLTLRRCGEGGGQCRGQRGVRGGPPARGRARCPLKRMARHRNCRCVAHLVVQVVAHLLVWTTLTPWSCTSDGEGGGRGGGKRERGRLGICVGVGVGGRTRGGVALQCPARVAAFMYRTISISISGLVCLWRAASVACCGWRTHHKPSPHPPVGPFVGEKE
jgi:hypothetical protein